MVNLLLLEEGCRKTYLIRLVSATSFEGLQARVERAEARAVGIISLQRVSIDV